MLLPAHQIWGNFLGGVADVIQKSEDTHQNPNHNTKANQQKYLQNQVTLNILILDIIPVQYS